MSGALFGDFGAPIGNDTPVAFDGLDGVVVTHSVCQLLMGVVDGPADAPWHGEKGISVDLTYAVPPEGTPVSDEHLAHLVAVADLDGRIAFLGHSSAAVEAAISQVLDFAGRGEA